MSHLLDIMCEETFTKTCFNFKFVFTSYACTLCAVKKKKKKCIFAFKIFLKVIGLLDSNKECFSFLNRLNKCTFLPYHMHYTGSERLTQSCVIHV